MIFPAGPSQPKMLISRAVDFTIKAKDTEIAALQKKLAESAGDSQTVASLRKELESIKKEALAVAGTAKKEVSANKGALAAKDFGDQGKGRPDQGQGR